LDIALYILKNLTVIALTVVNLAFLGRAVLSWLMEDESKIENFLIFITEPFVLPIRALMVKFNILQDSPVDFSTFFTSMIIVMIVVMIV
jgi:uncharacterized protein YggT (Ycf19 family)